MPHYSPKQTLLLELLGDGKIHTMRALKLIIRSDNDSTFRVHMLQLRRKLREVNANLDIIIASDVSETSYRLVKQVPAYLNDCCLAY